MTIYRSAEITGPAQFDGLTEDTGLFIPKTEDGVVFLGGPNQQVRINRMMLMSKKSDPITSMTSWTLTDVDPSDEFDAEFLTDTTLGFQFANLGITPTEEDTEGFRTGLVTVGLVGTGRFIVDYDVVETES